MRIKTRVCFTPGITCEPKFVVKTTNRPMNTFVIYPGDFVQLHAKDVTFEARSERGTILLEVSCLNALEFATDTDISGHAALRERKLQPWVPDSDIPAVSLE